MNKFIFLFPLTLMICNAFAAPVELTGFEQDYLDELNEARTNPTMYASYLESHLKNFIDDKKYMEDGAIYTTNEGKKAYVEAIEFLKKQTPLEALSLSEGMTLAAREHVKDHGPKGTFSHSSTDGTTPDQRVNKYGVWMRAFGENLSASSQSARHHMMLLIVDDGILSRGHRTTIFNPKFKKVGVGCGFHKVYKIMCTADFAFDFKDRTVGGPVDEFETGR